MATGGWVLLACALMLLLAAVSFRQELVSWFKVPREPLVPLFVPLGLLAGGSFLLLQARNVGRRDLTSVSRAKVLQAVAGVAMGVVLGLLGLGSTGLVAAYVCGLIVSVLAMPNDLRDLWRAVLEVRLADVARVLATYGRQLLAAVGVALINVASNAGPALLLLVFYDSTVLGWYGLVFRLATAPVGVVTSAIAQSFWAEAAELVRHDVDGLRKFYLETVYRLSVLAVPFVATALLGPLYIPKIFGGDEWSGAGHILMALTPYLLGIIVFSPTTHLVVYGKVHWQLWLDLCTLCIGAAVFSVFAIAGWAAWVALLGISVTMFAGYVIRFLVHLRANSLSGRRVSITTR